MHWVMLRLLVIGVHLARLKLSRQVEVVAAEHLDSRIFYQAEQVMGSYSVEEVANTHEPRVRIPV